MSLHAEPLQLQCDQIGQTAFGGSLAHTAIGCDHNVEIQDFIKKGCLLMCKCKGVIIQIKDPDTDDMLTPGVNEVVKSSLEQRHTTTLQLQYLI